MNLSDITPMLLTFNEEANLERTLDALGWAARIVLVDSGSSDLTLEIAGRNPVVDVVARPFDNFAAQRNFGLQAVATPWTLALDADHRVSPELAAELAALDPGSHHAFEAPFRYYVWGKPLRCAILPPRPVLLRTDGCSYLEDGHAERLMVSGSTGRLRHDIAHDDRKPLDRWFKAQSRYARQEADKLASGLPLAAADRVRRLPWLAPLAVFFYVLVVRGGLLDGRRGWFYAYQRLLAELQLALYQLDDQAPKQAGDKSHES